MKININMNILDENGKPVSYWLLAYVIFLFVATFYLVSRSYPFDTYSASDWVLLAIVAVSCVLLLYYWNTRKHSSENAGKETTLQVLRIGADAISRSILFLVIIAALFILLLIAAFLLNPFWHF